VIMFRTTFHNEKSGMLQIFNIRDMANKSDINVSRNILGSLCGIQVLEVRHVEIREDILIQYKEGEDTRKKYQFYRNFFFFLRS